MPVVGTVKSWIVEPAKLNVVEGAPHTAVADAESASSDVLAKSESFMLVCLPEEVRALKPSKDRAK
jgi:hypothetical protein